jgi:hypothetical protein
MTELNTLLNDVHTNLETKIKELYETKLKEHMENISFKLSDAYTKDYGKIDIYKVKYDSEYLIKAQNKMSTIDKSRYIIHYLQVSSGGFINRSSPTPHMLIFDNYGDYMYFQYLQPNNTSYTINPSYYTSSKFILPNKLIDSIKSFNNLQLWCEELHNSHKYYSTIVERIKIIAEDYYNRFMIDKPLVEENKKLTEENEILKKSLIKSTNEISTQTETINDDIKVVIENNVLTIFYYNQDELNLCDYLPKLKKDIEKDGRTITINYTNIERVCIICSDFKKITKYYQGIKHIQLFKCKNFERIPNYLKNDLEFFTIDGKNQLENNNPPPYS